MPHLTENTDSSQSPIYVSSLLLYDGSVRDRPHRRELIQHRLPNLKIHLLELFDWWKRIVWVFVFPLGSQGEERGCGRNDSAQTENRARAHSGAGLMKTASMFAQTASVGLRMSTLMKYWFEILQFFPTLIKNSMRCLIHTTSTRINEFKTSL